MMREGIQSSLKDPLKSYGCYLLSLMKATERVKGFEFGTDDMITDLCIKLQQERLISETCFVSKPDQLLSYLMGEKWSFRRGGVDDTADIVIYELVKPGYQHFVLKNDDGTYWDPLDPKRPAASTYSKGSTRLFNKC